jgi:hypothetical protein
MEYEEFFHSLFILVSPKETLFEGAEFLVKKISDPSTYMKRKIFP